MISPGPFSRQAAMTRSPDPGYIASYANGRLRQQSDRALSGLSRCTLCPRGCRVDRVAGELGVCRTGRFARVASFTPHFGEERPLVGNLGSGTIFFTHCNLLCLFCQNFEISHEGAGEEVSDEELAAMMIALQEQGCHNINFVSPSHVVPQILKALEIAVAMGLRVPLVFNTGGYDLPETLELLEGVVDIYMPDFKFWDAGIAERACQAADYPQVVQAAIREMHRQVGDLALDEDGIARRGLLVRHLVLPGGLAGTRQVMRFIAGEISRDTYVNVMSQYRPCGRAHTLKGLHNRLTPAEYHAAVQAALDEGIHRLDSLNRGRRRQ
ncbi:MAG: radical SAM protein [Desulfobacterales bacterium]|jgi:putative pyruvate formate lyase activating enzyme|nr:radical SAM protein [Desulfobacterales bacterium]